MAHTWNPPAAGTPCWINILATDVSRARKFYGDVFGWQFRDSHDPNVDMCHFDTPDKGCPDGGITKVPEAEFVRSKGKGGVALYYSVDDLEAAAKQIVKAGGKKASEVMPEGDHAIMQNFEDSEGNYFGIHEWKGKRA